MATALDVRSAQAPLRSTPTTGPRTAAPKVTQWQVIRSEWIKFWSLRSTPITLISAVVVFVGMGMLASLISTNADVTQMHAEMSGGQSGFAGISGPTEISLSGLNLAQLVFGTLGVLFMAGEYSTGMIRATPDGRTEAVAGALGEDRRTRRGGLRRHPGRRLRRLLRRTADHRRRWCDAERPGRAAGQSSALPST